MEAHKTWMQQVMPGILRDQLRDTACKALDAPVGTAVARIERATEAAEHASRDLRALGNEHTWAKFGAMMAAALAASAAASLVAMWMLPAKEAPAMTASQRSLLNLGLATATVWAKLPADAQGMIRAEAEAETAATTGQKPHAGVDLRPARQAKRVRLQAKRKEQAGQDPVEAPAPQQPGGK